MNMMSSRLMEAEERELDVIPFERPDGTLMTLVELECVAIDHAMNACGGDARAAAHMLGIGKSTIYRKLRVLGYDSENTEIMRRPREVGHQ